jgi:Domain of unknown function (DUF4328)
VTDTIPWVCGNCRSINPEGTSRCYSCRAPRALAVGAADRGVATKVDDRASPVEAARIARQGGASYRSSATRALIVQLMIVVVTLVTLLEIVVLEATIAAISSETASIASVESAGRLLLLLVAGEFLAWIVAFVAWGAWLSRLVSNVPALGGGWPRSSSDAAFVSSIVPGYNLYSATSILRDAMVRLSEAGKARTGLLTAWWIFLLLAILPIIGLIPGPVFLIRLGYRLLIDLVVGVVAAVTHSELSATLVANAVNGLLLVSAATLAILLVNHLEELQEARVPIAEAVRT